MRWRASRDMKEGVEEMLLKAPATVPFPELWWPYRDRRIRDAVLNGRYAHAMKLLNNHGQTSSWQLAEALWLRGWLNLEYLNQPRQAYEDFYRLFKHVNFPVSKARGAYWAGRAAEKNGNTEIANSWFTQGASYPTTFYGQLCATKKAANAPLRMPAHINPTAAERSRFMARAETRAVLLLAEVNRQDMAWSIMQNLVNLANTPAEHSLAANLPLEISRTDLGVKAAKLALQKNFVVQDVGYPVQNYTSKATIERPLVHAIIRQESEFNPRVSSPADARGLMQLLPSTAQETARRNGMAYRESGLYEPLYNVQLGSLYLQQLVNQFDNSYVKAIAAYNAGPGRVRQWQGIMGIPAKSPEAVINWMERIPFAETRNYVQRVLENLQVYRHMLNKGGQTPHLQIRQDLVRGL
jgi:soluble lytic murein transglycosylase